MKRIAFLVALTFLFSFPLYTQTLPGSKRDNLSHPNWPIPRGVMSHDPSFKRTSSSSVCFYKRKSEWQKIIDSTWGPGLPLAEKLSVFDTYANFIRAHNPTFVYTKLNWDSVAAYWRSKITDSTSRGGFSAILSSLAYQLHDGHGWAWDTVMSATPLNPGTPIIADIPWDGVGGSGPVSHFGAGLTALPDSSLLVYMVTPNHPLGLEPGDIVLGYEGLPWKNLVLELMASGIPSVLVNGTCPSASEYYPLVCAGENWHLFDTIDVVKYKTGQTVHLPTDTLISLKPTTQLINGAQIPVPGVPMPGWIWLGTYPSSPAVTFGTVQGTDIGYIYVYHHENDNVGAQFNAAVTALSQTHGLIIDIRFDPGGWSGLNDGIARLTSYAGPTLESLARSSPSDFWSLVPWSTMNYTIPQDYLRYEYPVAVLVGPTAGSYGDMTSKQLTYLDCVRFFGKSPNGAYGGMWNAIAPQPNIPGFDLNCAEFTIVDKHFPDRQLWGQEFPIDEHAWLTPDGAAKGEDDVVKSALQWINTSSYAYDFTLNKTYFSLGSDTVFLRAKVNHPNVHPLIVKAYFQSGTTIVDSSLLFDDGLHGDGIAGDSVWGAMWKTPPEEAYYNVSVSTNDPVDGSSFTLPDVDRFTTAGPVILDSTVLSRAGTTSYNFTPYFRNNGLSDTITKVSVLFSSQKPGVKMFIPNQVSLPDILPHSDVSYRYPMYITVDTGTFTGEFNIAFDIQHDNYTYWRDSVHLIAGVVHVISPNGGEAWEGKTTDTVTWTSTGVSNVRIEMSMDNGVSWPVVIIGSTPAATGSYVFKVPDLPSGQCRIRVRDVAFRLLNDISDTTFTITPSPIVMATVDGSKGWNLLSIPLCLQDFRVDSVYPARIMPVFEYTDHYCQCETLKCGRGYWVRLSAPLVLTHTGRVLDSSVIDVKSGWNMIGSISTPIATTMITSNPGGLVTSQFFGYEGGYDQIDSLRPGKGYWVKVSQDGQLILKLSSIMVNVSNQIRIVPTDDLPPTAPDGKGTADLIPNTFALHQSYPNPFNSTATIQYDVPTSIWVTLKVYDMLGREVATLVNDMESPGYKQVTFNANSLPTGIYTYRLTAGSFMQTKKMILMK